MRNAIIAAAIVGSLVALSSCVTAPANPKGPSDTLLVGQLTFDLSGFRTYGGATVNGTQTQGVQISLKNVSTGKMIKTETYGRNGLFFIANLPPADYLVEHLYYKAVSGQSWADINFQLGPPAQFKLAPTGVTDIGLVLAKYNSNGGNSVTSRKTYEQVRGAFTKMFPRSMWNSAKWNDVTIYTGQ